MTRRKTALADVTGPECSIKESIHSASLSEIFTATRRASPPFGFNGGRGIALTFAHFESQVVDTPAQSAAASRQASSGPPKLQNSAIVKRAARGFHKPERPRLNLSGLDPLVLPFRLLGATG